MEYTFKRIFPWPFLTADIECTPLNASPNAPGGCRRGRLKPHTLVEKRLGQGKDCYVIVNVCDCVFIIINFCQR